MNTTNEPIAVTEGVRVFVLAVIALLTAFNAWNPTPEQVGAILGVIATGSILLSVLARRKSTPTAQVALTVDQVDKLNEGGN